MPDHPLQRMTESVAGVGLPGFLPARRSGGASFTSLGEDDDNETFAPAGRSREPRTHPRHGSTSSSGVGWKVTRRHPRSPATGPRRSDARAGYPDRPVQHAAHGTRKERLAQDPGRTRPFSAALLPGPQAQGWLSHRAGPPQPGPEAPARDGAGVEARGAGRRHHPDLHELPAWTRFLDEQAGSGAPRPRAMA